MNKATRDRIAARVKYRIECLPEDTVPYGNCLSSGDDALDRAEATRIERELARGNAWAWCVVKVTAYYPGTGLMGIDYLCGCSYESEKDFKQGGYYDDMKEAALSQLLMQAEKLAYLLHEGGSDEAPSEHQYP